MSNWLVRCATPPAAGGRGGAGATATHTFPASVASASGVPPSRIVLVALPERGSRRITVPSPPFATQRPVGMATIAVGPAPTCVVPVTAFVPASTWTTSSSPASATHAPAALTATAAGP